MSRWARSAEECDDGLAEGAREWVSEQKTDQFRKV